MIIAIIEDGTLEIVADAAEACLRYEGVDVESGVIRFFVSDFSLHRARGVSVDYR